jgi:O-antigen/teichoic acid export membrane protein
VALAAVPMCFGLAALAEPAVLGLFGAQWRGMIPLVRILSASALAQSITGLSSSVFLSQGARTCICASRCCRAPVRSSPC